MLKRLTTIGSALAMSMVIASSAVAGVSAQEAARLGNDLNPMGGIRAGNGRDVSTGLGIPAWDGGMTRDRIPSGYTRPGQHHPDPFPDDQRLFTINAQNMSEHAARLPDGVKALLETYPDTFNVPVYRSRRTSSAPDWVYENIKKNATTAQLGSDATGVTNAFGGIPFPILHGSNEQKALQAVWNHILRWRGVYVVRRASEVAVQRNGAYSLVTSQQEVYFRYYDREFDYDTLDNIVFYYLSFTMAPARLAGGAVLVHETLDQAKQARQAWGYNAGTRRVQRSPNLQFDTPIAASDGLRTADDTDIYNGSPERYNWRLLSEEPVEMFIPYNNYRLDSPSIEYSDLLMPGHVNPEHTRWELHRVWKVEATLKEGERHVYERRVFYIDEDSWQIVVADQYDRRGDLWRVSLAYMKNYYEVPTNWTALDTYHDLRSRRYHVQQMNNEEPSSLDFTQPVPNPRYFMPQELRRRGR